MCGQALVPGKNLRRRVTELAAGGGLEILKTVKADGWGNVALNVS